MIYSAFAMLLSGIVLIALHLSRRSRHVWIAVLAMALAVLTFLSGLSIAPFVAPFGILALVAAALTVPRARAARDVS